METERSEIEDHTRDNEVRDSYVQEHVRECKDNQDGTGPDGKPIHVEWSGKLDEKDYPVTGDANVDSRAYAKVNERTLQVTAKKNGKVTATAQTVVSADGKTRTSTVSGTTVKGKTFHNTVVYDKQ